MFEWWSTCRSNSGLENKLSQRSQTEKTPKDFGQVNQPVFETLESIRKVITMPMTGEEIKNTFDISPGLKINSKTVFRPLS